jgi:shikimate kinase
MKGTPGTRQEEALPAEGKVRVRAIFLVGFMGAGKTSVGRVLSRNLGWPFVDLDDRIQAREGRSIAEIFQQAGESHFRETEFAALEELLREVEGGEPLIVALGGGAFVQDRIASLLENSGSVTVFLDAPASELWRRCDADMVKRPLRRQEEDFRHLYEKRRPRYLEAQVRIETAGREIEFIAREIANSLRLNPGVSGQEK